jgi:rhodanese-related sulfurtransferase
LPDEAISDHRNLTIDEVKQGLASRSVLLVDVREPNEFALAHIAGAVNFPLSTGWHTSADHL